MVPQTAKDMALVILFFFLSLSLSHLFIVLIIIRTIKAMLCSPAIWIKKWLESPIKSGQFGDGGSY